MNDRTRGLKDVLWVLLICGAMAIGFRLWYGLGATTNLSDAVPWGLWKILNMVAGVALATGGFTVGFLVYVLKLDQFRPLVKPAILIAFLGYGCSVFALVIDIGLPHRIWHPIVMWNERSFLFEVAWCVMLYFTVTAIELSPTVLERFGLKRLVGFLHRIAPGVVIVGISLSSLHHSSLGSLFLVTPQRLHPLWYSPRLPLLFILSAMGAGMMVVVLVRILHARWTMPEDCQPGRICETGGCAADTPLGRDLPMLRGLATIGAGVMGLYLVLKGADLFWTGAWRQLITGTWESWLYVGEIITAAVVPMVLVALPRTRNTTEGLLTASAFAAAGLAWNRLDVGIFGYFRDAGTVYFPSIAEWAVCLGVVAGAALLFLYVSENFAVFEGESHVARKETVTFIPSFDRLAGVWYRVLPGPLHRVTLLAVLLVPLSWVALRPAHTSIHLSNARPARPPVALNADRSVLTIDGNRTGVSTEFRHLVHQKRLGGQGSCNSCHHLSMPGDRSTPCVRCHQDMERPTDIFDHTAHFTWVARSKSLVGRIETNLSCGECHNETSPKSAEGARPCLDCHERDMKPTVQPMQPMGLAFAPGYRSAMHGTCIPCHQLSRGQVDRPHLADCSTCHPSSGHRSLKTSLKGMDDGPRSNQR